MTKKRSANGSRAALLTTPAYLVATARAAHLAGDSELATIARDELYERFGIRLLFDKERTLTTGARLLALQEEQGDA